MYSQPLDWVRTNNVLLFVCFCLFECFLIENQVAYSNNAGHIILKSGSLRF